MKKEIISTDKAPRARIPNSQATRFGQLVFTSGSVGRDPGTGQMAGTDIKSQAQQVMENLKAILEAAGTSLDNVLKATCYLRDIGDFAGFNEVYFSYFTSNQPARTCTQAGALGSGVLVEVDMVACIPDHS